MEITLTSHRTRLALAALLATFAALVLTGCVVTRTVEEGTDSGPEVTADTVVNVSAFEFGYTLSATEVEAGTIQFVLVNDGGMAHDLVLEDGTGGATSVIGAGETDDFTVTLEPGTYTLYCSVGNHRAQGMEVQITVS